MNISVRMPDDMVKELDRIAEDMGISRASVIKIFIKKQMKEEVK